MEEDIDRLERMDVLHNVYSVFARFRSLKGKDIHTLTDSERRVLRYLRDNGFI